MFNRKFSSNIRKKKRMIISSIILLVVFLGLGYSAFTTNLGINGTLNVSKYDQTLYGVLERAAKKGYAREYTGEHQDSMAGVGTKKIYHWYAPSTSAGNTLATEILDKNNVIFADHCWQMIRTTDTGGVKMIYNGEVENGQCLNTRGTHVGYESRTTQSMSTTYYYGTSYNYDKTNNVFSIGGEVTTGTIQIGQYTCKGTNYSDTCSTLYLVDAIQNGTTYYVITLKGNSHYSQFGTLQFDQSWKSPSYVGYMQGDNYPYENTYGTTSYSFESSYIQTMLDSAMINSSYLVADSVTWSSNTYTLDNPYQISSLGDYSSLIGKYTFNNTTPNSHYTAAYYITYVDNDKLYYKRLTNGEMGSSWSTIKLANSITDNGNDTYTLNNAEDVTWREWYENYANYANKYHCSGNTITCTKPRYITSTRLDKYNYMEIEKKLIIAKERNGLVLDDYITVRKDELVKNPNNYSEYKYTCISYVDTEPTTTCAPANLKLIISITAEGFDYATNHYYGTSVTWDGENYTLVDPIEIENYNNLSNLSTHHFICPELGAKVCSQVGYVYFYQGQGSLYHVLLKNGITSIDKALEDMFTQNTNDSAIKIGVDAWYKNKLLEYSEYIEDTIYCNDRNITNIGGWNPNGGSLTASLQFENSSVTNNLKCTNNTDRFSINNSLAKLKYPVGLISAPEIYVLTNSNISKTGTPYYTMSPYRFTHNIGAYNCIINNSGSFGTSQVYYISGLRPVISLKPGTEYASGSGSMADPYIVE